MTIASRGLERVQRQTFRPSFEAVFLSIFFVAFCGLAFLFPFSGDDWAWGSQIGESRLNSLFANYNGRYAGNLAVLFLTRASLLTPFVVAATVSLTIFLVVDLTDNRTKLGYSVVALLFLGMPQGVWRQSIAWVSGFSNYAIAALCVLLYLRAAKSEWLGLPRQPAGVWRYVAIFIFGFITQLFMEHVTFYLVVASFVSLVLYRIKFGIFSKYGVYWFASFLSGAIFMFSNNAYRTAASADAGYQQIQTGGDGSGFGSIFEKLSDTISNYTVTQNTLANITIILLVCLLVSFSAMARGRKVVVFGLAILFLAVAFLLRDPDAYLSLSVANKRMAGVAAALLLMTLGSVALFVIQDKGRRNQLYVCCASIVVLIAPLVLVEPIGPRCFYPTYLFFLLIVSLLLRELGEGSRVSASTRITPFLVAGVVVLFASQFAVYGVIHRAADDRLAYVQAQVKDGATVVRVKRLPFSGYVHDPDPVGFWSRRYKLFYHLPDELTIKVSAAGVS